MSSTEVILLENSYSALLEMNLGASQGSFDLTIQESLKGIVYNFFIFGQISYFE